MCKLYFSRKEVELKKDNMLISSSKVAFVYLDSYKAMNASFIKKKNGMLKKSWGGRGGPHYTAYGISSSLTRVEPVHLCW